MLLISPKQWNTMVCLFRERSGGIKGVVNLCTPTKEFIIVDAGFRAIS